MNRIELDEVPSKNRIWTANEEFAEAYLASADRCILEGGHAARPSHPYRELWFCPTVTIWDAHRAAKLFHEHDIQRVYDLGAGDLRFSLWLDRGGYEVTAYELNENLATAVKDRFYLGDVKLRIRDYYEDYNDLVASDAAVVAFGSTNKLPRVPAKGLAIQGYCETGITAWYDEEVVARW